MLHWVTITGAAESFTLQSDAQHLEPLPVPSSHSSDCSALAHSSTWGCPSIEVSAFASHRRWPNPTALSQAGPGLDTTEDVAAAPWGVTHLYTTPVHKHPEAWDSLLSSLFFTLDSHRNVRTSFPCSFLGCASSRSIWVLEPNCRTQLELLHFPLSERQNHHWIGCGELGARLCRFSQQRWWVLQQEPFRAGGKSALCRVVLKTATTGRLFLPIPVNSVKEPRVQSANQSRPRWGGLRLQGTAVLWGNRGRG